MSLEVLKSAIANVNTNLSYMDRSMGEESTKHSLVLPIIKALGYDTYNPREVRPEFSSDPRDSKKGQKEKVDYAIFIEDKPVILVEVKNFSESLKRHTGQLQYYCNALLSVRLGILTNGIEWQFYTDTKNVNHLDDEPFFTIDLTATNDDERLAVLYSFAKKDFQPSNVQELGWKLKYTRLLTEFFMDQFDNKDGELSENFVRWVLKTAECYPGSLTSRALEQFHPLVKKAFRSVIGQMVSRKYLQVSHLMQDPKSTELPASESAQTKEEEEYSEEDMALTPVHSDKASGIVTTEEELASYAIVKSIIEEEFKTRLIFDPSLRDKIAITPGYKDTTGYFGVYINKPAWWVTRMSLSSKVKWLGFNSEESRLLPAGFTLLEPNSVAPMRVVIEKTIDIYKLRPLIIKSVENVIEEKESG